MTEQQHLLVIDDEENMCHVLKVLLERHGYQVTTETAAERALALLESETFSFILCDVRMPGMDGLSFIKKASERLNDCPVIMMSAYGSVESAIEAMKAGAYDFISKPFKTDEVLLALKKAEEREQLKRENVTLREQIAEISGGLRFGSMVAASPLMAELFEVAERIAHYNTTVLISGESGTGKELIARGIHRASPRRDKPFVAVNCGSIPANLLESELFGHVRGAFTGADTERKGLFREADGATLFLDEIGELPQPMQVKLLRVLQEQEVRPVGSGKTAKVDVRVLAATARRLEEQVAGGAFREDLYYRLNVMPLTVPPLRDRKEDIPPLCLHFIKKFNTSLDVQVQGIRPAAMSRLLEYRWPGNVRELENILQRAMVLTQSGYIEEEHVPEVVTKNVTADVCLVDSCRIDMIDGNLSIKQAQRQMEARMIMLALARCAGNKSKAATLLDLSYPSLLSKIKQYGLEP
ncbi:sigma-54-dependent transcriptional regulator [Desulfofustis glycolicus]|uniref:Two component, sigma54 specific, transcriptional regulator, Fis family n=1 Tax=Desulfofustis glycolicus DSM 9705 TaxID=1121409 RepID=A0A1M5X8T6_9BACT|nr:sigma-54 dependent transcriptional regulator [Desulfofustis glycolicus]SHH95924.1 two component, sigma54 specific, transcriptional regulator, Fis family [Desulfofustis glycolicus DSM 9705]